MFGTIKYRLNKHKRAREWRSRNKNNSTVCVNEFNFDNVSIGNFTYGELKVLNFGKNEKLEIGAFCSIASGVVFSLNADHPYNRISTFPFKAKILNLGMNEATSKGDIIIEDDVWIGQNAIILSGVRVGQGAVIAAGAVVSKDVPPYAIVGGVPARVIKYRFSPEVIEHLLKLDYSKLTDDMIRERIDDLYTSLDGKSPEEVEKLLAWFPKK